MSWLKYHRRAAVKATEEYSMRDPRTAIRTQIIEAELVIEHCQNELVRAKSVLPILKRTLKQLDIKLGTDETTLDDSRAVQPVLSIETPYAQDGKEGAKANNLVKYALKHGNLTREPCEVCDEKPHTVNGRQYVVAYQSGDYDNPLDVKWLCRPHYHSAMRDARAKGKHRRSDNRDKHPVEPRDLT